MAHYDIFRDQLAIKYPAYGHALWEPSPWPLSIPVEVGDVGFIRDGKFHRLFNALRPADDPSHQRLRVPEYYEQLRPSIEEHIVSGTIGSHDFYSRGVIKASAGSEASATEPPTPGQVTFSCTKKQGAVLSLPVQAERQNTLARGNFRDHIIRHIDRWFAFAQRLGLGIDQMEDIILVTGRDRARSCTNVAFSESQSEVDARVSFGVQVSDQVGIKWSFSNEHVLGALLNEGRSGKNLLEDQCVFIRGWRVIRTLVILRRLRGAAEPSPDLDEYDSESEKQAVYFPTNFKRCDPLHTLLRYLAERVPESDMVAVHDDDLVEFVEKICGNTSIESFRVDVMMADLQRAKPEIELVWCDVSSINQSNSPTKTEMVCVAMLSIGDKEGNTGIPSKRISELVTVEQTKQPAFKTMSRSAQNRIRVQSQSRTGSVNSEDAESSDVGPSETGSIGGRTGNSTQNSHKKTLTIEEREAAYNEARSRIFMDFEDKENGTSTNSSTFSLVSGSASTSRGGSISAGDVSDSISTTPTKTSPSLAKAQWSSQNLIRDVYVDVGPPAEESTKTNVGRLLVSLQWQHMDKIYSARVQASMIIGDLKAGTWPDPLPLQMGIGDYQEWVTRAMNLMTGEPSTMSFSAVSTTEKQNFDQLLRWLRETCNYAAASWTIQGEGRSTRNLVLWRCNDSVFAAIFPFSGTRLLPQLGPPGQRLHADQPVSLQVYQENPPSDPGRGKTMLASASTTSKKGFGVSVSPSLKPILPATTWYPTASWPLQFESPVFGKISHKAAEQKRRDSLKTTFDDLRTLLPPITLPTEEGCPDEAILPPPRTPPRGNVDDPKRGISKLQLLRSGNDYIRLLKEKISRRDNEISLLRSEVQRLRGFISEDVWREGAEEIDLERDVDFGELGPWRRSTGSYGADDMEVDVAE